MLLRLPSSPLASHLASGRHVEELPGTPWPTTWEVLRRLDELRRDKEDDKRGPHVNHMEIEKGTGVF